MSTYPANPHNVAEAIPGPIPDPIPGPIPGPTPDPILGPNTGTIPDPMGTIPVTGNPSGVYVDRIRPVFDYEEKELQPPRPVKGQSRANPVPLGLFSFASTTLLLSFVNIHTRHVTKPNIVVGMAFSVGGLAQFVAGILEFFVGDTLGMTAFCSYGAFWISLGFLFWPSSGMIAAYTSTELDDALGLFMMTWCLFTFLLLLGAFRESFGIVAVFFFLAVTFLMLSVGNFSSQESILKAGGWFGVITAVIAYYVALQTLLTAETAAFCLPNPSFAGKIDKID